MRLPHEIAIFQTVKSKVIISLFETVRLSVSISLRNLYNSLNSIKEQSILSTHDQKLWWNATVNLSADATSYSGSVSGTTTKKSTPEVLSKPQKPEIPPAVKGKTEIGAFGMPITIPTQKQADEIYKKRIEQYHKIKGTYGPTITPDLHQM